MTRPPRHALQSKARVAKQRAFARLGKSHHDDESDDKDANGDPQDREEADMDAPRVAQWVDDDEQDEQARSDGVDSDGTHEDDHSAGEARASRRLLSLEDDLSSLPFGTLRSAQRSLSQAQALSDTESSSKGHTEHDFSTSEDDGSSPPPAQQGRNKEIHDRPSRPKNIAAKRSNKHAPVEVTSKRPVSRRRTVVDDTLPKPRDPRFMHAVGHYDPHKFKRQYDFLSDVRRDELSTLREHTKRARKFLANSPLDLRAAREDEVNRLARALKRAESAINLDDRERVESEALRSAKQAEKEKRKRGKAGWWMKRSERKALLIKARMDAIASVGGKQAVKKAVEKRQKKTSQKEKKTRPFPRREGTERSDSAQRRRPVGSVDGGRGAKRRKVA